MTTSPQEHLVAIVSFEGAVKREVKRVRERLKSVTDLSAFELKIAAEGRVQDGDVKLSYIVNDGTYSGLSVTADSLEAAITEFMRRKGWIAQHDPKAIGYAKVPGDDANPEEVPF